jgi:hypothetical protein
MKRQLIWFVILNLGLALVAGCRSKPPEPTPVHSFKRNATERHAAEPAPTPAPIVTAPSTATPPPAPAPGTNTPPVEAPLPAPARVEEGTSVRFDEVMAAVPVEGAHQVYQNLHVGIAATITPHTGTPFNPSQVGWLLHKLEPRVSAATLQVVTDSGTISPRKVGALRDAVVAKIQEVVAQTLSTWEPSANYEVEVTVVSMYFTDSTVGRSDHGRRGLQ